MNSLEMQLFFYITLNIKRIHYKKGIISEDKYDCTKLKYYKLLIHIILSIESFMGVLKGVLYEAAFGHNSIDVFSCGM